jgi:hypothetical protein
VDVIIGIRQFLSDTMAETILIIPFEEMFLGMTDDESLFRPSFKSASHVQDAVIDPPLICLGAEIDGLPTIPDLVYEPQTAQIPGINSAVIEPTRSSEKGQDASIVSWTILPVAAERV